eukprot:TRINITY_DN3847_c1_g1_i1.p1 TRINITY_DN3847_c1_g1~~TRINITY_DN3847_c1_g1_i1.p1  ORF type:complete len:248 (+),score=68.59 TRINITY_DN3847_c1_g1_i1:69-746(+)
MALRATQPCQSAQKLLVKQRMREREGKEFIPGRVIWDEVTMSGPANFKIEPPAPMKGPLGWKTWFHEKGLQEHCKEFEQGLFAWKVHALMQEEFQKIEEHPPAEASHHGIGGKVLIPHQLIDTERKSQTCSSIPKDAYELQKFIDEKKSYHESELFSITSNYEWQKSQEFQYRNTMSGSLCEDARMLDDVLDEEEAGKLFGGQVAQSFVLAWLTLLFVTLVWRIK